MNSATYSVSPVAVTIDFVMDLVSSRAVQKLYKLSAPVLVRDDRDMHGNVVNRVETLFVVISSTSVMGRDETYIFPADDRGNIISYNEMNGSYMDGLDHAEAIRGAGWIATCVGKGEAI